MTNKPEEEAAKIRKLPSSAPSVFFKPKPLFAFHGDRFVPCFQMKVKLHKEGKSFRLERRPRMRNSVEWIGIERGTCYDKQTRRGSGKNTEAPLSDPFRIFEPKPLFGRRRDHFLPCFQTKAKPQCTATCNGRKDGRAIRACLSPVSHYQCIATTHTLFLPTAASKPVYSNNLRST